MIRAKRPIEMKLLPGPQRQVLADMNGAGGALVTGAAVAERAKIWAKEFGSIRPRPGGRLGPRSLIMIALYGITPRVGRLSQASGRNPASALLSVLILSPAPLSELPDRPAAGTCLQPMSTQFK